MKGETRMQRIFRKAEQMKNRGIICSEERKITSGLMTQGAERDYGNLATFIHNENVKES